MRKKHQKHAKLTRPDYGHFARNEWAIIGTPCGDIQNLAYQLTKGLSQKYKVSYVDADHKSADEASAKKSNEQNAMDHGAHFEYTDKITHHRFEQKTDLNLHQYRMLFNEQDIALVNGNHFLAKQQIVVIDPRKEKSLAKKLDRLTDVQLILLADGVTNIPTFLKEYLMESEVGVRPILDLSDVDAILSFLESKMQEAIPPIAGLVLAGGKSLRMGTDKGAIKYHQKIQREHIYDQLDHLCESTYLSCRPEQTASMLLDFAVISDSFAGLGPFGAILSAFREQPNKAWLVIACDLPLMDQTTLAYLIEQRDPSKIATAFNSPVNEFPEPLIAIWEPKSYPILLQFLAQGYSCPRKVLINSDVHLIDAPDAKTLMNVNSPEDYDVVMQVLNGE